VFFVIELKSRAVEIAGIQLLLPRGRVKWVGITVEERDRVSAHDGKV